MGTTTSPQQQNLQAGADKDPCEVLLSMLYPRLFSTKSHLLHDAFIRHTMFTIHVCQAEQKTNPSSIISFKDKGEHCLKKFSFRNISTTARDHPMLRAVSPKTKLNSQHD